MMKVEGKPIIKENFFCSRYKKKKERESELSKSERELVFLSFSLCKCKTQAQWWHKIDPQLPYLCRSQLALFSVLETWCLLWTALNLNITEKFKGANPQRWKNVRDQMRVRVSGSGDCVLRQSCVSLALVASRRKFLDFKSQVTIQQEGTLSCTSGFRTQEWTSDVQTNLYLNP